MAENIPLAARRPAKPVPIKVMATTPKPPKHLSAEAKGMWKSIVSEWVLGVDALGILKSGLEAYDVAQKCRESVERDGLTFRTETGAIRANPAAKIGLDHAKEYRMALRQLGLQPEE